MDAEIKAKWLGALRSGKYRQTRNAVRDEQGFCCLGVLCDVAGAEWKSNDSGFYVAYRDDSSVTGTPETLDDEIGLLAEHREAVMSLNDLDGKSFSEIADYIEANIPTPPLTQGQQSGDSK
jgi:hypothetical protein